MARVTLRALARSSGVAGLAEGVRVVSSFVLTPIILAQIGLAGLGVWTLLFSLTHSINVLGVSFGNAYAKFTAEHDARGDYDGLAALVGSGLLVVGGLAGAGLGLLVWLREPLLALAGVPAALLPDASTAFVLVATTMFGLLSLGCVRQILAGLQRTDLGYAAQIVTALVYLALAALLLSRGYGLVGLAVANLVGEGVGIALGWLWCRRLCPALRISPRHATREGLRRALSLGGRFQLLFLLNYAQNQGLRVLMSALLGPAMLGAYELGKRLIRLCETASAAILAPMMPAFAHLHSGGERARARRIHDRGARALVTAAAISMGFVALFADRALWLWTGDPQPLSAWTIRVLAFAYVFKQLSSMGTASMRARGAFRIELLSMAFSLVGWLALLGALYPWLGYRAFVWSEALAHVATALVFLWPFARVEGISLPRLLADAAARPLLAVAPPLLATGALAHTLPLRLPGLSPRFAALAELALWGALFVALAAPAVWRIVLDADERTRLGALVPRSPGG